MSDRNIEPELSDFFRRVATPEPSARLRRAVADARTAEHAGGAFWRRFAADSRLGLSLVTLAVSIVLSAGMLFVAYGRGGVGIAGPDDSPSASPSAAASPTPTLGPAFTFGPPGTFKAVADTTLGPSSAVRLPDGRVFLTDGDQFQIYDPAADKFGNIGKFDAPHVRGTVTGLPDGSVLIAGGMDTQTGYGIDTAMVYNPSTGKSTPTGSLVRARFDQYAVALSDGRVLLLGGYSVTQTPLQSAEIYDPITRKFTQTGNMVVNRHCATTVRLADGRVLIAGGDFTFGFPFAGTQLTAEVFDPATGKFTATGSMTTDRSCAAGALLPDGRVLVAGGDTLLTGVAGSAEVYDPQTGTFVRTGNMVTGRSSHSAITLADGRVLIAGGIGQPEGIASVDPRIFAMTDDRYLNSAELYDPDTGKFTKIGPMLSRRVGQTATLLKDGRVLLVGGTLDTTSAEVYVP
jgi:hypothetical protein